MAFNVGSVVAEITADVSGFQKGIKTVENEASGLGDKIKGATAAVGAFAVKASILSGIVGAGLILFLKNSSQEAMNFEKSLTTLDIIAGRFGVSGQDAAKAAQELGKQLRIGVGPAAESIQNLLKSGLNLEQSTDLLKRFTNEAITGKSPQISLSQAVQNLSFAYATNNSAIGNLSGINENFINIIEKGRAALIAEGKAAGDITDEMAKYRGMIDLTNLTMWSSERFTGTLIDQQAVLGQKLLEVKVAFGQAVNPAIAQFIDIINQSGIINDLQNFATNVLPKVIESLRGFGNWISENQTMVKEFLTGLVIGLGAILIVAPLIVLAMHPFILILGAIAVAIGALYVAWKNNFMGVRDTTQVVVNAIVDFFNNFLKPVLDMFMNWFVERWDYIKMYLVGWWDFVKGVIQVAWAIIYGILTVGLALLQGDWQKAWDQLKKAAEMGWNGLENIFGGIIKMIIGFAGTALNELVKPFEEAWNKIRDLVNKIKDALDFTKRNSPSVVDIVSTGVGKVNDALSKLDWGINAAPQAAAAITNTTGGPSINNIVVSLDGAMVGDMGQAEALGERIGDSIIRKLQMNVRL
jgi:hypothetical protein